MAAHDFGVAEILLNLFLHLRFMRREKKVKDPLLGWFFSILTVKKSQPKYLFENLMTNSSLIYSFGYFSLDLSHMTSRKQRQVDFGKKLLCVCRCNLAVRRNFSIKLEESNQRRVKSCAITLRQCPTKMSYILAQKNHIKINTLLLAKCYNSNIKKKDQ